MGRQTTLIFNQPQSRPQPPHHHGRIAGQGRRVIAPPCPRSTARLQRSPIGRVESFRSWSSHLFRGRRHVWSGGRLSDTLMWQIFQRLDNSPNVKYSITLWTVQDLKKVGNTNSICVVKYSTLHNIVMSCLHKLVHVCLAVISSTVFSHRIFKYKTIKWRKCFTWKYKTALHFLCTCLCLFTVLPSSQIYWHIRLKSTAYFFEPPLELWRWQVNVTSTISSAADVGLSATVVSELKLTLVTLVWYRITHTHTHSGADNSVAEWLACWTQPQWGSGSNRSCNAVG